MKRERGPSRDARRRPCRPLPVCLFGLSVLAATACDSDYMQRIEQQVERFSAPASPQKPRAEAKLIATAYLQEWLEVGSARCRVEHVEAQLTEPVSEGRDGRVVPDLQALALKVACENRSERPLSLDAALPSDALWFLRDAQGLPRAPSQRTKLSLSPDPGLIFEVPHDNPGLQAQRHFDLDTGRALFSADADQVSRLSLESHGELRQFVLRHRQADEALDAWLTQLVQALVQGQAAGAPLRAQDFTRLSEMYRSVRERFAPTRLRVSDLRSDPDSQLVVTLLLERPKAHDAPSPVASVRLALPNEPARYAQDARLLNITDGRKAVACQEESQDLRARFVPKVAVKLSEEDSCNLLGLVFPARCDQLSDELKRDALAHRMRCVSELEHAARITAQSVNLPKDFQITLRRGRRTEGFDHSPRFVLSVFGNGAVVFHGRSFVHGIGRSDGRTSPRLLKRLVAQLKELAWFERRGGQWSPTGCSTDNPRGDVITTRVNERERMVLDREGCRGPFSADELRELSALVELVAGVSGWTEPEREAHDTAQPVSEWIVSAD